MLVVVFGVLAGVLFGLLAVTVRLGLHRSGDTEAGPFVVAGVGFVVAAVVAIPELVTDDVRAGELWPFFVIGLLVPGLSQIILVLAVRDAGASRTSILIGTAPLMSVAIALAVLNEPLDPWLLLGTALIVAGGGVLALERARPEHFKAIGAVLALTCAALFAIRDNVARWAERDTHPPALVATATSLLAASLFIFVYLLALRRSALRTTRLRPAFAAFAVSGLVLGLAYSSLIEAFDHGRVSVVAPLNATQSLWSIAFAWVLLGRHHEAIHARLVFACVLVVAGGAIIGIAR